MLIHEVEETWTVYLSPQTGLSHVGARFTPASKARKGISSTAGICQSIGHSLVLLEDQFFGPIFFKISPQTHPHLGLRRFSNPQALCYPVVQ